MARNDNFTFYGIDPDLVSDFSLRVFNRWGQEWPPPPT